MKRIRKLDRPTPGLAGYLQECADGKANWEGFRDHRDHTGRSSYHELVESLVRLQHGLCGYCEIDLKKSDRQVEHVIPRSAPGQGASQSLDAGNMIACCVGGTARSLHGPDAAYDEERYREPAKRNTSCGQAKGNRSVAVDPRTLPELPSVTKVRSNGTIEADGEACAGCGLDAKKVTEAIDVLGLNVERLRLARRKRWETLSLIWSEHLQNPHLMEEAARSEILPDGGGLLPGYFTTSRTWFGAFGERVLAQDRSWV